MEKNYDTDGFDVYMLLSDVVCQPSYEMEMLQRNHISGILDMRLRYIDGEGCGIGMYMFVDLCIWQIRNAG